MRNLDQQHRRHHRPGARGPAGLIRSRRQAPGGRGQPATLLRLDPEGAYSIGVQDRPALARHDPGRFRRPGAGAAAAASAPFPLPEEAVAMHGSRTSQPCARQLLPGRAAAADRPRHRHALQHGQLAARARHPARGAYRRLERVRPRRASWPPRPGSPSSPRTTAPQRPWPSCSRAVAANSTTFSTCSSARPSAAAWSSAATTIAARMAMPAISG